MADEGLNAKWLLLLYSKRAFSPVRRVLEVILFLSPPPRGTGFSYEQTGDRVPSNRRLQSPPGRTGSLARGSYNYRKRSLRRSRCEHGATGVLHFFLLPGR